MVPKYKKSDLSIRRAILLVTAPILLWTTLSLLPAGEWLENRLSRPLEFRIRHWLKKDPNLSSQIKIYTVDDITIHALRKKEPTLEEWTLLFKSLAKSKPAGVFIDAVMGMPAGLESAKQFVEVVKAQPYPTIVGSFVHSAPIKGVEPLPPGFEPFYFPDLGIEIKGGIPYGPAKEILPAFSKVGHLMYRGDSFVYSFYRINQTHAIPSAPLLAARELQSRETKLILDGHVVPTDLQGRILVNLAYPPTYYRSTLSLMEPFARAKQGLPLEDVPENAWIVLHLNFGTGSTDWVDTPHGKIPGAYVPVALLNSVLTNQWITLSKGRAFSVLFLSLIGGFLGFLLRAKQAWITLAMGLFLIPLLGIGSFSYLNLEVNWFLSMGGFISSLFILAFERMRAIEKSVSRLKAALEDAISEEHLDEILKTPPELALVPQSTVITVMFLDVVGFSKIAEKLNPEEAFNHLREIMIRLSKQVRAHHGVVEKTLGDGLLCFFGYHYSNKLSQENHALNALKCSIAIQLENAEYIRQAAQNKGVLFPFRIGIDTGAVFVGDLCSTKRVDLTIIGHGVNMAKRLEEASDAHCVMIGATTKEMLRVSHSDELTKLEKRYIEVKHRSELVEAFECNPFRDKPQILADAKKAYQEFCGWQRRDVRWQLPNDLFIAFTSNHGSGYVVNFSEFGFGAVLDQYLAVGVTLQTTIESEQTDLGKRLRSLRLLPLVCEVRWGKPLGDGRYLHGLQNKNLNEDQRRLLLDELKRFAMENNGVTVSKIVA